MKYLLLIVCSIMFSCQEKSNDQAAKQNSPSATETAVSEDYHPATFNNDRRMQIIQSLKDSLGLIIRENATRKHIPSVSFGILADDSLVYSYSSGVNNLRSDAPDSISIESVFRIASMSKSFTAMAILILRDRNLLKLSDPAYKYIPALSEITYPTTDSRPISIENLLTMTAGFPEDNPWGDRQLDEPDSMLLNMISSDISFSNVPSYEYEYSNLGYALLGNIISEVAGIPYQQFIRENIWEPLDMHSTYWEFSNIPDNKMVYGYRYEDLQWKEEPILGDGSFGSMGGIWTSIEDFSKYVALHLSAWPPRSGPENAVIDRASIREMHQGKFSRLNANSKDFQGNDCPTMVSYGYGLRVTRNCRGLISVAHGGALPGYGSSYVFYPEYGIGIMAFGNLTYTGPLPDARIEDLLFSRPDMKKRKLPVSSILSENYEFVKKAVLDWNPKLKESDKFAENFWLDRSFMNRKETISTVINTIGEPVEITEIIPLNQLRGYFDIIGEDSKARVFFTLNPEHPPKIQQLEVWEE